MPVQALQSRISRLIALWSARARSAMGVRRGMHSADSAVYYKELSAERLARALGPRGRGFKDYRVTFADGSKQMIRCSPDRCYADLMGPSGLERLGRVGPILRPGGRVLEIAAAPMTTGYSGVWLARVLGPSGAVVSLMADEQGARFAERRYATPTLSIERVADGSGVLEALGGEMDGAFDAIIHLGMPEKTGDRERLARGLWRVLRPGGWMLAAMGAADSAAKSQLRELLESLGQLVEDADAPAPTNSRDLLVRKWAEKR